MYLENGKLNIIIDGQFGSTGKGLISAYLGRTECVDIFLSNLSPNAGHTFDLNDEMVVTKQLPVGAIINDRSQIYLTAGSIINPSLLLQELERFNISSDRILIHPRAAIITEEDINNEQADNSSVTKIASTQSGVGEALVRKINRSSKLAQDTAELKHLVAKLDVMNLLDFGCTALFESSQGYDLGINSGLSYPFCTSRDVNIAKFLSDSQIHPSYLGKTIMSIRSYPIRVGSIVKDNKILGESGPFFPDSIELTWEELNEERELTTVTQRVRRIATFSEEQYKNTLHHIRPDYVFFNFANYIKDEEYLQNIIDIFNRTQFPDFIGTGPKTTDVYEIEDDMLDMLVGENRRNQVGLSKRYG